MCVFLTQSFEAATSGFRPPLCLIRVQKVSAIILTRSIGMGVAENPQLAVGIGSKSRLTLDDYHFRF
jgi:hypothetical protein